MGWAFALVPAIGLLELIAHGVQTCGHVDEGGWRAARDYVAAHATGDDLVAFAPRWAEPLGREFFGPEVATVEREARADETRFARAFEVSIRNAHDGSLAGWRRGEEQRFGSVRVTTWENPAPVPVIVDLVSRLDGAHARASLVQTGGENDCAFVRTGVVSGSLGFGPAVPSEHFACPAGGFVAVSVVADLDYHPRRCIYAPPPGPGAVRRLHFPEVHLGKSLQRPPRALRRGRASQDRRARHDHVPRRRLDRGPGGAPRRRRVEAVRVRHVALRRHRRGGRRRRQLVELGPAARTASRPRRDEDAHARLAVLARPPPATDRLARPRDRGGAGAGVRRWPPRHRARASASRATSRSTFVRLRATGASG